MDVSIIGLGRVGSSVAFGLVVTNAFKGRLFLAEAVREKLEGEYHDLFHASKILKSTVTPVKAEKNDIARSDVVVISAGLARPDSNTSHDDLYEFNKKIVDDVASHLGDAEGKTVLVISHPVERLAEHLSKITKATVVPIGRILDSTREKTDKVKGEQILDLKGYTNWGVAAETIQKITDISSRKK